MFIENIFFGSYTIIIIIKHLFFILHLILCRTFYIFEVFIFLVFHLKHWVALVLFGNFLPWWDIFISSERIILFWRTFLLIHILCRLGMWSFLTWWRYFLRFWLRQLLSLSFIHLEIVTLLRFRLSYLSWLWLDISVWKDLLLLKFPILQDYCLLYHVDIVIIKLSICNISIIVRQKKMFLLFRLMIEHIRVGFWRNNTIIWVIFRYLQRNLSINFFELSLLLSLFFFFIWKIIEWTMFF